MTPHIYNVDGYVLDTDVNEHLGVTDISVIHNASDHSVTLIADQLWMTDVGKLAGLPLSAFKGAVDPRNWDDCVATKSFFISMQEVPPRKPLGSWPKVIDETVRLHPGSRHPDVTARLAFNYDARGNPVKCTFDLVNAGEIIVDKGWVKATKVTDYVTDANGVSGRVTFFRFTSQKRIKFAHEPPLPDPVLANLWGWAVTSLIDCAG